MITPGVAGEPDDMPFGTRLSLTQAERPVRPVLHVEKLHHSLAHIKTPKSEMFRDQGESQVRTTGVKIG